MDTIAMEVDSVPPFAVTRKCSVPTSDFVGSAFLKRRFEDAVRQRLGVHGDELEKLGHLSLSGIMDGFEQYTPNEHLTIPVRGAPDIPEIGLESGYITMER